jgi:hypothetical protein
MGQALDLGSSTRRPTSEFTMVGAKPPAGRKALKSALFEGPTEEESRISSPVSGVTGKGYRAARNDRRGDAGERQIVAISATFLMGSRRMRMSSARETLLLIFGAADFLVCGRILGLIEPGCRVLINAQIAAGYGFTLRLRHGDAFLRHGYGCPKNRTHRYRRSGA